MTLPLIIIGNGGHAQVLVDLLRRQDLEIIGYASPAGAAVSTNGADLKHIGDDDAVLSYPARSVRLVNGVGSIGDGNGRKTVFEKFRNKNYQFASAIHDTSIIAGDVTMGEGAQVMAGVIVQTGCRLRDNIVLNTGCRVDHHCEVGDHCHISPGAVLAGSVKLGEDVHVGAGATIIQDIAIGTGCLIAAGSLVAESVPSNSRVAGVPARPM